MVSMAQMEGCRKLDSEGLEHLPLPHGENTPIPGLILYVDEGHKQLEVLMPDGRAVDLLKVWRLAEDCVRNWQKDSSMPKFVGDFKRLTPLAEALYGRKVV